MLQIYFIRHGQSENNVIMDELERHHYLFHRIEDPKLTEIGLKQAELVADFLAAGEPSEGPDEQNRSGFGLTHLYCSLMSRAVQTAVPIARKTGLPLKAWPEVHETGGVFLAEKEDDKIIWNGLPGNGRSYYETNFPELILPEDLSDEGWWNREKEPREHYNLRAQSIVDRLIDEHGGTNHRVGIVMHGGIFTRILTVLFDIQGKRYWFLMNNCGISRVDIRDNGRLTLSYMNKTDYLPDDLITS
ncbi:MAG: histidine phosphatase family protein [Chloroflexota bacterium]|nr:histidine phosphatase family protein [Chloroflexota bacterium]